MTLVARVTSRGRALGRVIGSGIALVVRGISSGIALVVIKVD